MKKLLLLIIPFLFVSTVKADTIYNNTHIRDLSSFTPAFSTASNLIESNNYNYYAIFLPVTGNIDMIYLYFFDYPSTITQELTSDYWSISLSGDYYYSIYYDGTIGTSGSTSTFTSYIFYYGYFIDSEYNYYAFYDSNYNFTSYYDIAINGIYSDTIYISNGSPIPSIKNLLQYNSWVDYVSSVGYTTVNLDNYEYVILSLKNYSQTEAFQTDLFLKGQIGITPVYNYGQTSKDSVTGSQVQDRCNLSYNDFTPYPFYILQSDLQNNAVYYVKSCSSGSSFKFDNSIFDITYITQTNLNDPTITIGGKTYTTIPYSDLPSSATKNEENNYIPGESGSSTSVGGLDSAIKSAQNSLSSLWNTITYFTDFVGLTFSTLPTELRTILLSAFIICITLGIIKLFVGH